MLPAHAVTPTHKFPPLSPPHPNPLPPPHHLRSTLSQPRMNRNSQKAVKEIRGSSYETNMPAGERLYRNSEQVYLMRAR